jgi:hypothetical protein
LARTRPKDGRGRLAKLGALRTLERLERDAARRRPQPKPLPLLELWMGPTEGFGPTAEELEAIWPAARERVMSFEPRSDPGSRAWAYWRCDLGLERPTDPWHDEPVRLAELGLLADWELAHFKQAADEGRPLIGTDGENNYWPKGTGSKQQDAVRLWDAIQAAMADA